eukprot:6183166-Pleurochrysis_carterae.AAC.5
MLLKRDERLPDLEQLWVGVVQPDRLRVQLGRRHRVWPAAKAELLAHALQPRQGRARRFQLELNL